ncbi:MAG: radical SAM protein, partial [Elusimicrobia bacterium]|nr:radical SAM protein [Elusimicrobiota bacterium]
SPDKADLPAARTFLYRALNAYENKCSVFIEGLPFCFLPDAYDHIPPPRRCGKNVFPAICKKCRLRPVCPGLRPGPLLSGSAQLLRPVLATPNELVIEVNRRCNLACAVCSARGLDEELSFGTMLRHIRRARRLGIKDIRFTGGEPFLHPQIIKTLAAAKKNGFHVLVNTNATLLSPALIKQIAPLTDNILVSLQGHDERSEAEATGTPGLFTKKLANIRALRRAGIPVLRLGTVISEDLLANFEKYLRLAKELDADIWELYRPMLPAGNGPAQTATPAALRRLARRLEAGLGCRPRVLFANPLPLCVFEKKQAPLFLGARFDDGHTRLVLDPRGFYKPSYYIQKNLGPDILAAWNSSFLKKTCGLDYLGKKCSRCAFRLRCLGGSRFLALTWRGSRFKPDPWLAG